MALCYETLMMPTRYGRMTTNVVSRLSLLSKSLVTPPLEVDMQKVLWGTPIKKYENFGIKDRIQ